MRRRTKCIGRSILLSNRCSAESLNVAQPLPAAALALCQRRRAQLARKRVSYSGGFGSPAAIGFASGSMVTCDMGARHTRQSGSADLFRALSGSLGSTE